MDGIAWARSGNRDVSQILTYALLEGHYVPAARVMVLTAVATSERDNDLYYGVRSPDFASGFSGLSTKVLA